MDNLIFEKVWKDNDLLELKFTACSEFVTTHQMCYIQDTVLSELAGKLCDFANNYTESCYLEFGNKTGNYTPAFSMCLLPADNFGHVKIEVDIEIDDNDTRSHRCCFYVNSELGLVEHLGCSLKGLVKAELGTRVEMFS